MIGIGPEHDGGRRAPADRAEATLAALVAEVAGGSVAALRALYDETSALVYSACRRLAATTAAADALTGEVYTEVWREAAARYRPGRVPVTAWLLTLVACAHTAR